MAEGDQQASTETIIITALSTLTPPQLSHLTHTISSAFHRRHHHRLSSLLSSPTLFSQTLHHLHSLSLPHKSLLLSRYLLSTLRHLTLFFTTPPPPQTTVLKLQDYDAVLLLLVLCELHQQYPEALETPQAEWRGILGGYLLDNMLSISGIGVHTGAVLIQYIEVVARCLRFVGAVGGGGEKLGTEVAASPAVVVALPSVEVSGVGLECVICKEEMRRGRDVCELPCEHLFHWMCILPWLSKRNTCPCCRFRLPSDDVFGEIQRLWGVVVKMGSGRRSDGESR
ncbi:hypothetical protein L1049_008489 [Liquidambar formosana]|uniref:RING-type E3 ubiquitin transferase n=1 Tax=Liquidambar formosana TaxID=63359 RepID=A0AAP0S4B8_LIQFO